MPKTSSRSSRSTESAAAEIVSDVQAGRPVQTSTGAVIQRKSGPFAQCDTILSILQFCFWVSLMGVSAAAIRNIQVDKDAGNGSLCFLRADAVWRETIGILVVSTAGVCHSLITFFLGACKNRAHTAKAAAVRYTLNICILPHAIVLVVLGCIVLSWMAPEPIGANITRAFVLDLCQNVRPFDLAWASGAMAVAFGGFVLLFVPMCMLISCFHEVGGMAYMVAQIVGQEAKALAANPETVTTAKRSTRRVATAVYEEAEDSYDAGGDDEEGYGGYEE
jgi:hypothetical protein